MPYGIANPRGQPPAAAVEAMLDRAWEAGISTFDTAPGYGEAEGLLGSWIKARDVVPHIATKLPGLGAISDTDAGIAVEKAIEASATRLGIRPATYLTHDAADYLRPAIRECLLEAAAQGKVGAVGMSAYTDAEVFAALEAGPPQAIQLPVSALDQRMVTGRALAACAAASVRVFARSVFLQGALLMGSDRLPAALDRLRAPLAQFDELCAETKSTRASLALRFVRDLPGVSSTVIGAYSADQLEASIAAAREPPLTDSQRREIVAIGKNIPIEAIDPRRWPKRA
jgi:aryl-alcohol dehydrogenase-like predicted oxidoreductase